MTTTKFTWNQAVLKALESQITNGLQKLGEAIVKAERSHAPVDKGTLVQSIRVERESPTKMLVIAGGNSNGSSVPYARRRNFENKLHPNTKHYVENGVEEVIRGGIAQYFKGGVTK